MTFIQDIRLSNELYSLTEKHHVGKVKEIEEYYDLVSVIMVCLGKNEKETENEFNIPMTEKFEAEVEVVKKCRGNR